MANELTNFLVSLRKLHTFFLYVDRPLFVDGNTRIWHKKDGHHYDVRSQQRTMLNAVRCAIKLNPALRQLYVTQRLPPGNSKDNICRVVEIVVQSEDSVVEKCWFVHNSAHMKRCEMECQCDDEDWEWKSEKTFLGRHMLPML